MVPPYSAVRHDCAPQPVWVAVWTREREQELASVLFQSRAFGWRSSYYATYAHPAPVPSQLELKRTANQRIQGSLLKLRHWSGSSTGHDDHVRVQETGLLLLPFD